MLVYFEWIKGLYITCHYRTIDADAAAETGFSVHHLQAAKLMWSAAFKESSAH